MSFKEWIFSSYPNPHIDGAWKLPHILVLLLCIAFIVASTLLLKKKQKVKFILLLSFAALIVVFGLTRRIVNFVKTTDYSFRNVLSILLPRPGCAISCWLVVLAVIINKKYFYNLASIIGILCGGIFFIYPGAGFNNEFILFENLYSIATHALFFTMSICFVTYKFADFNYKKPVGDGFCFLGLLFYVILDIWVFKIEKDPFYFMPNNDVQEIVGLDYGLYLPLYALFIIVFVGLFYLIPALKKRKAK